MDFHKVVYRIIGICIREGQSKCGCDRTCNTGSDKKKVAVYHLTIHTVVPIMQITMVNLVMVGDRNIYLCEHKKDLKADLDSHGIIYGRNMVTDCDSIFIHSPVRHSYIAMSKIRKYISKYYVIIIINLL